MLDVVVVVADKFSRTANKRISTCLRFDCRPLRIECVPKTSSV